MPGRLTRTLAALLAIGGGFTLAALPDVQARGWARDAGPVTTPSVSTPSVAPPPVTVPSVTVPSVSTPAGSTPSVSTPSVSTPSVSSPGGSHTGGGGTRGGGSGSASGSISSALNRTTPGVVSGLAGTAGNVSVASGAGAGSSSSASGPSTGSSAQRAGSDHHGGLTKRYLHRLVAQFYGCLSVIGSRPANVLTLRTGWGISRSYSRRAVARMLHVSLAREGRIEHQAVAELGSANRHGSCARAVRANRSALFLSPAEQALLGQALPRAFVSSARSPSRAHRSKPAHRRSSVSAASTGGVPGSIPSLPHPGTSSFPWLFVVLALIAATALVSPAGRRRWLRPRTAGGAAAGLGAAALEHERESADGDPGAASGLGARLERQGDIEGALAAYRRADAGGDAAGATNLGVLLEQRGDLEGALAAYRRADERGDANGSFNLGCLLAERGDVQGAVGALQRADQRGDPAGASNLGVLLEQEGDLDGALGAYRRADERGDANGSFNLGLLLANRGDMAGAQEAYRRAGERGDPDVAERARSALADLSENGQPGPRQGAPSP